MAGAEAREVSSGLIVESVVHLIKGLDFFQILSCVLYCVETRQVFPLRASGSSSVICRRQGLPGFISQHCSATKIR